MDQQIIHQPSAAAEDLVYLAQGTAWVLEGRLALDNPGASDGPAHPIRPRALVHEDLDCRFVLGHPARHQAVVVRSTAGGYEVAIHGTRDPTGTALGTFGTAPVPIGWATPDHVLLGLRGEDAALVENVILDVTGTRTVPDHLRGVNHLGSIDHDPDGHHPESTIITTAGIHPAHWRSYRGGAAGRLQRLGPHVPTDLPVAIGNAADGRILRERLYFLDDLHGAVDVYSTRTDGAGPITRHTRFTGLGATSLHRSKDRLVVGAAGRAWILDPGAESLIAVSVPTRPSPESPLMADAGSPLGPAEWVVAEDRSQDGRTVLLARTATEVFVHGLDPAGQQCHTLQVPGLRDHHVDHLVTAAGRTVVSSDVAGVAEVLTDGSLRWLSTVRCHRRGRPALRPDGELVAWTEETGNRGASLHVVDLTSGEQTHLEVPGTHLGAPAFTREGELVFSARPVSPWAGTASPLEGVERWCSLAAEDTVLQARSGRVDVRADPGERPGPAQAVPSRRPHPRAVLEQVLHLASFFPGGAARGAALGVPEGRVTEELRGLTGRVRDREDLALLVRCALREIGQSHAGLRDHAEHTEHAVPAADGGSADLLTRLRHHSRSVLASEAEYLVVPDVSTSGYAAVRDLCRRWRGNRPLVLDLRYNSGGQLADHLAALLTHMLQRSAAARVAGSAVIPLIEGPDRAVVLINESTGSGGEHLAALLSEHPRATVLGRRTVGAGTGFHRRWDLGWDFSITLPQYRLGGSPSRWVLENRGLSPDREHPSCPTAGVGLDDALLQDTLREVRAGAGPQTTTTERGCR
ncbi:MAG: S41 family peptidase [Citricoccus sp.]